MCILLIIAIVAFADSLGGDIWSVVGYENKFLFKYHIGVDCSAKKLKKLFARYMYMYVHVTFIIQL